MKPSGLENAKDPVGRARGLDPGLSGLSGMGTRPLKPESSPNEIFACGVEMGFLGMRLGDRYINFIPKIYDKDQNI